MITVGIIGTGQIGYDLLLKLLKLNFVKVIAYVGRRPSTKSVPDGVHYSDRSIQFFIDNPRCCQVVFDCTDAYSAVRNAKVFSEQDMYIIDLTPSNLGINYVPNVSSNFGKHISTVTCGGQASIPLINYIMGCSAGVKYIEVVSQISSESAGMATRLNVDKYIHTTEQVIRDVFEIDNVKVILTLNPGSSTVMQTSVFVKVDEYNDDGNVESFVKGMNTYVPGYKLTTNPTMMKPGVVFANTKIISTSEYISSYSGNLDVINCVAIEALKKIYTSEHNAYNSILDI